MCPEDCVARRISCTQGRNTIFPPAALKCPPGPASSEERTLWPCWYAHRFWPCSTRLGTPGSCPWSRSARFVRFSLCLEPTLAFVSSYGATCWALSVSVWPLKSEERKAVAVREVFEKKSSSGLWKTRTRPVTSSGSAIPSKQFQSGVFSSLGVETVPTHIVS